MTLQRVVQILLSFLLLASVEILADSVVVPDKWMVELEAAPALEYEGGQSFALRTADGAVSYKPLAATAPEATGQLRYDANTPAVQAYVRWLDSERAQVLDLLSMDLGRLVEANRVYHHVFNGFEASLSEEEAARLAELPGVRSVEPVLAYRPMLDTSPGLIGASAVHAGTAGIPARGGEGVVIGIIDSGINWTHPYFSDQPLPSGHVFINPYGRFLGECSSSGVHCNNKLVGVYDFTVEGTRGKDPTGHGTHVASIAAGVPRAVTLSETGSHVYHTTGMAPHATIISYKVCYDEHPSNEDLNGRCEVSAITEALEQVVKDRVDVVNYSIGGEPFNPWSGRNLEPLNVWSAGIAFVASAGNEGPGLDSLLSPANAPWVLSIGASTHDRRQGRAATVAGLGDRIVVYGEGSGLTSERTAPLLAAQALTGSSLACDAFPAGSLNGAIVLIERGLCNFSVKVDHAANAGAVAVLVYNNVHGAPIKMGGLEDTTIPAAMLSRGDGLQVLEHLAQPGSHSATLHTSSLVSKETRWADQLADFSSRGPARFAPGLMKPNVVAPGVNILGGDYTGSNPYEFMRGTSMASPHVAGAVVLLRSIHPHWTPAMLHSALETTAELDNLRYDGRAATAYDRGNGRIRVDRAARAGLFLPITRSQYLAANPAQGGDPGALNLAGMWSDSCVPDCSFVRTVQALGAGTWQVRVTGNARLAVTPQAFTLSAGQSQLLQIEVDGRSIPAGSLAEGLIELIPEQEDFETQHLMVAVQMIGLELAQPLEFSVNRNRGQLTRRVEVGPLPEALFETSDLVEPQRERFQLRQDPASEDPYSSASVHETFFVDVPEDTLMFVADAASSRALDLGLYVGRSLDGGSRARSGEELCQASIKGPRASCVIRLPEPGRWWVMVQNRQASSEGANDAVELDLAVLQASDGHKLVVSGPGHHPGGTAMLHFSWDEPEMQQNRGRIAALRISTSPDRPGDLALVPVRIKRISPNTPQPTALFAGEQRAVVLPARATHDLLFVDVPSSATALEVRVEGQDGVNGSLHHLPFSQLSGHIPGTPPAPAHGALASGSGSASGYVLKHAAAGGLEAGRYYIVLDNTHNAERRVWVTVQLQESHGILADFGLWQPRDRVSYQGFDWEFGLADGTRIGSLVWYSYDADGLPVFYNAVEKLQEDRSTWTTPLLRTTSIGLRNNISTVGEVALTALGPDDMMVAWRLDGAHGSERLVPGHGRSCAQPGISYNGHWHAPAVAEGGTTMIVTDASQAQVRYYFDELGIGRWVITDDQDGAGPLGEQLSVLDVRGFCPNCEEAPVSFERVGSYVRIFHDADRATEIIEFDSAAPLNGHYSAELEIERLTVPLDCE